MLVLLAVSASALQMTGWRPSSFSPSMVRTSVLRMNFFDKLMKEVDAFADDAMGRRLGNGAKFYGKRRSTFYGEDDEQRKEDPQAFDREEDYSGPAGGSYF